MEGFSYSKANKEKAVHWAEVRHHDVMSYSLLVHLPHHPLCLVLDANALPSVRCKLIVNQCHCSTPYIALCALQDTLYD